MSMLSSKGVLGGHLYFSSLVPRPSSPPVFDRLQYAKTERSKTGAREGLGMRLYFSPSAHLVALNLTDWVTHGDLVPWLHQPTHTKIRDTRLNRSQCLGYPRKSHHSLISTVWIPSPVSGRLKGITLPRRASERLFIVHKLGVVHHPTPSQLDG